ncbi:MAG TPA: PQQ-dependent sugar dehydrogenase, partial [Vicinamibacterales bacterium]|nr:PQQ-dependent sugar dehydrogenase [Vicinamibacterales bacterium]
FASVPITGLPVGKTSNEVLLSRVNAIREEPGGADRLFVVDMNGPVYILDKKSRQFTKYLDFDGRDDRPGIFHRLFITSGYGNGLNGFYFDPDYRRNGKFYTVHMEDPALTVSNLPDNKNQAGLKIDGYAVTPTIATPGTTINEGVLIEWTDANTSNASFEGTARELMRVRLNTRSHPMGDLTFNPAARPGDPDWRVLYGEVGDGASGESRIVAIRNNPQRLDTLVGKIIRIIPDLTEHVSTSTVSENGRYRIPNDNPFVKTTGARPEIWAYGLRNPHRLSWGPDPSNPRGAKLIANSVGYHTWETVNLIERGSNHGWPYREGNQVLSPDQRSHGPLPEVDKIPTQIGEAISDDVVTPKYPVIQYAHDQKGGDAIGSGYVYTGTLIPALVGKYIFGDITTGRFWYADYKDMVAADADNSAATQAKYYDVTFLWDNPNDSPDAGKQLYDTMWPINEMIYHARGGKEEHLASRQQIANQGRADARLAVDGNGELYIYSKSDGMIRQVVGGRTK